jgi:cardiolipin synthase (CMP-forming)
MLTRQQIPNLLTFARVAAVPASLAIMLIAPPWAAIALLWIFIAASLTDFLDGYLARRWNATSALGTMLDPVADKLLVALMLVYLVVLEGGIASPEFTPANAGAARLAMEGYAPIIPASGAPATTHDLFVFFHPSALSPLFLPVIVILLRELYISGLREFLAARQIALPVSTSGKWKTALQMLAIFCLLVGHAYGGGTQPLFCAAPLVAAFSQACALVDSALLRAAQFTGLPLLYLSALLALTSAIAYTRASLKSLA